MVYGHFKTQRSYLYNSYKRYFCADQYLFILGSLSNEVDEMIKYRKNHSVELIELYQVLIGIWELLVSLLFDYLN